MQLNLVDGRDDPRFRVKEFFDMVDTIVTHTGTADLAGGYSIFNRSPGFKTFCLSGEGRVNEI